MESKRIKVFPLHSSQLGSEIVSFIFSHFLGFSFLLAVLSCAVRV